MSNYSDSVWKYRQHISLRAQCGRKIFLFDIWIDKMWKCKQLQRQLQRCCPYVNKCTFKWGASEMQLICLQTEKLRRRRHWRVSLEPWDATALELMCWRQSRYGRLQMYKFTSQLLIVSAEWRYYCDGMAQIYFEPTEDFENSAFWWGGRREWRSVLRWEEHATYLCDTNHL